MYNFYPILSAGTWPVFGNAVREREEDPDAGPKCPKAGASHGHGWGFSGYPNGFF